MFAKNPENKTINEKINTFASVLISNLNNAFEFLTLIHWNRSKIEPITNTPHQNGGRHFTNDETQSENIMAST